MTGKVRDNPKSQRYELELDGGLAFIDYRRRDHVVTLTHAEVPMALRGAGLGAELVRERGERVVPHCAFVALYMRRHPESHDLLA